MKQQYRIVFFEQNNSGGSQLAATLLSQQAPTDFLVNYAVLHKNHKSPYQQTILQRLAKYFPDIIVNPIHFSTLLEPTYKVDLAIGLNLSSDNADLVQEMRQLGVEQNIAICVYWDLTHLTSHDPAIFSQALQAELQQRLQLIIAAKL